jgi:Ser/Thr protein kinase RdoA (MazF antagonist)
MVYDTTPLTPEIVDAVVRHWGVEATEDGERLHGGEESSAYRVGGNVIRIGPEWRSDAELEWSYAVTSHAAETVPEAVAPLRTAGGAAIVRVAGRPVSVWPYRAGTWADDDDDATFDQAADLLARLHRALSTYAPGPRPGPGPPFAAAPDLEDPELDGWLADFDAAHPDRQPLHGDYYDGNMLSADGRIVALLDWDETFVGPPERELAWAAWEWGDGLWTFDFAEAHEFIEAYHAAGGVAQGVDDIALRQIVRERIRREVRYARAVRARGIAHDDDDHEYEARQLEAFAVLRPGR